MLSGQYDDRETLPISGNDGAADLDEEQPISTGRARRSASGTGAQRGRRGREHIAGYNKVDEMDDESDATSSGGEWDGGDDDDVDEKVVDDEEDDDADMSDDEASVDDEDEETNIGKPSLVVSLRYHPDKPKDSRDIQDPPNVNGVPQTFATPSTASQTEATSPQVKPEGLPNNGTAVTPASSFDTNLTAYSQALPQMKMDGFAPQPDVESQRAEETQSAVPFSFAEPNSNITLPYQSAHI